MYRAQSETLWEDGDVNGHLTHISFDTTKSGAIAPGSSAISDPDGLRPENYYIGMERSLAQGASASNPRAPVSPASA